MSRFDYRRVLRVGVVAGALLAVGIWIVEEEVVPQVASPPPAEFVVYDERPALYSALQPGALPSLQGIIAGSDGAPGVAILAALVSGPSLVPEGELFNEDLRVERVRPDGVLLRRLSDNASVALILEPSAENALPMPSAGLQPPGPALPGSVSGGE
ncbi:MAG: hypothetical protein IPQ01_05605 [Zoogloea sp.]|nr:hypothetical protein [Zoogloea sp.]